MREYLACININYDLQYMRALDFKPSKPIVYTFIPPYYAFIYIYICHLNSVHQYYMYSNTTNSTGGLHTGYRWTRVCVHDTTRSPAEVGSTIRSNNSFTTKKKK